MATIYLIESGKTRLVRKSWLAPKCSEDHHIISSNYDGKTITKKPPQVSTVQINDWNPGINLMTFLMYNGAHPSRERVKAAIRSIQEFHHNDWTVNNMILQGNKLVLIDWDDLTHGQGGGRKCSPKVLKTHLRLAGLRDPARIEHYFWNRLVRIS